MDRDARGRFVSGNTVAQRGGRARMACLTPGERTALAKQGFAGLARKYFDGKRRKCAAWLFDPLGYRSA